MGKFPVILVVEDESLIRETIVQALRDAGLEVLQAVNGEGAIAQLGAAVQVIDVIFTDIQLGGSLSGWDVAEVARESRPGVSVIYTSGNSVDRRRQVGNSDFFGKPYETADIVEACRKRTV